MGKLPRRLANFYLPGTGQTAFSALFAGFSSLLLVGALLAFGSWVGVGAADSQPDLVTLDADADASQGPDVTLVVGGTDPLADLRAVWVPVVALATINFVLFFAAALILSHRVFGPVYRLASHIDRLNAGDYKQRLVLRGYDCFQDIATALNTLSATLVKQSGRQP